MKRNTEQSQHRVALTESGQDQEIAKSIKKSQPRSGPPEQLDQIIRWGCSIAHGMQPPHHLAANYTTCYQTLKPIPTSSHPSRQLQPSNLDYKTPSPHLFLVKPWSTMCYSHGTEMRHQPSRIMFKSQARSRSRGWSRH